MTTGQVELRADGAPKSSGPACHRRQSPYYQSCATNRATIDRSGLIPTLDVGTILHNAVGAARLAMAVAIGPDRSGMKVSPSDEN